MAHKTTINGTNYTIKSGKTTINGTNYKINKGKTKINGTNYTIGFTKTIVITGTGSNTDDAKTYVSINGVKYTKAATITVPMSTPILCYMSYNVSTSKTADQTITYNGTQVWRNEGDNDTTTDSPILRYTLNNSKDTNIVLAHSGSTSNGYTSSITITD